MDYSFPSAAWSDCHSNVALSWPEAALPGLQWLLSLRVHGGVAVTQRLLGWSLLEAGQDLPLKLEQREFYPEKVQEQSSTSGLSLSADYSWIERDTLQLSFSLKNTGSEHRKIEFSFEYEHKGRANPAVNGMPPRQRYEAGRRGYYGTGLRRMEGEDVGSWQVLIDFEKDPEAPFGEEYAISGKAYQLCCLTKLEDRTFELASGSEETFSVVLAFGSRWNDVRERYQRHSSLPTSWTPLQASKRTAELVESAPEIDPDFCGNADWERLYLQAVCGLNSVYVQGENGYAENLRLPWTCKHVLAGGFFWDTAFTSTGGVLINPEAAMESIEAFCINPNHRGALPANLTDLYVGGEGQYPILTWGAWNIYCTTKNKAWLSRIESSLRRHVEYWFTYHSRPNGICYIYNSALGSDDDARFDYCMKGKYNQPVHGIDSPDINALLVVELRALANMQEVLGNHQEAASLRERATKLNQQIIDLFYFEHDKIFWDVEEGTRDIKSGTLIPYLFLPLWAQVPLEKDAVAAMIETHMLNPDTFFREFPFPSLAYNHPEYDPEGYWRGRIWPHIVFWMAQILWLHGYEEESNQTAKNLLSMMLKTPWICENYNSETGIGWNPDTYRGWPGYNWCYATVILLMSGKHKLPPLPQVS